MKLFAAVLIGLYLALTTGSFAESQLCPVNLPASVFRKAFQSKCYAFFVKEDKAYGAAEKRCEQFGGTLALPKTSNINTFLAATLKNDVHSTSRAWIGLNDIAIEGQFRWEDGTKMNYDKDFHRFQKNEGKEWLKRNVEDCVAMDPKGTWHDYLCKSFKVFNIPISEDKEFICEFNSAIPTMESTTPTPPQTTGCPPFSCNIDCGISGFKADAHTGCFLCECEPE